MASVSGLALVGEDALMLHQPHQARDFDAPGDKYTYAINFDSPAFGKNNTVQLEALEMVVDELVVEFQLNKLSATGTSAAGAYVPVPNMVSDNGCQLFYNGQSVYTASEAELTLYPFANTENQMQLMRRLDMGNVYPKPVGALSVNRAVARNTAAATTALYYLDLRPFLKIMKHCGPLSAYAPNKWSISIGLLASTLVAYSNLAAASVVTGMNIASMRLLISGHREDAQNTMRISQALASDGIKLAFTQSNAFAFSLANATGATAFSITSLEGEATDIWMMNRVTAGLTGTTAAGAGVDKLQFLQLPNPNQTVAIGTQSNPTRVFGQVLPWETLRKIAQGASYNGGPIWLTSNATTAAAPDGAVMVDISAVMVPLAEAASDGQLYGTYSGSIRLKNDFVVNYAMGTAPGTGANTVNVIVYIRRLMVITHLGIVMMNEG